MSSGTTENLRDAMAHLIEERAVYKGEFRGPSGDRTDYYIDMAMILSDPTGLEIALNLILAELKKLKVDKIASPSVEADPIVAVVGTHANIGSLFIHQGRPIYAFEKALENLLQGSRRVVIIADVTLSGNTVLSAGKALRAAGAQVESAIALVDLERGARQLLSQNGIGLVSLINAGNIHPKS